MTEVKKGIGRLGVGLIICATLVGVLAVSSIWFYVRNNDLQNIVNSLETETYDLQSQMNSLTSEKNSLQNQVESLTTENDDLQDEVDDLTKENSQLEDKYDLYVANHHYSDSEYAMLYDEAQYHFYYVKPEEQKFGVYNLDDELSKLEWTEPYQAGVFDCSEMSTCLEWFLENMGWHVKIYSGDSPFGSGSHAWLIVETSEGKYMPVESTTLEVVWWSDTNFDNYWEYENRFETIQDAIAYSQSDYDWWEFGFSPLKCS